MEIIRAYKTELDPNNVQVSMLDRFCQARQFVFNIGLREWQRQYSAGEKPSAYSLKKQFNAVKYEYARHSPDFKMAIDSPYAVTESAFRDLGDAYKNFFRRVKNGEKNKGFPRLSKDANRFCVKNTRVEVDRVRITGAGWIRLKESGYLPTTDSGAEFTTYATISKRAGRWFISVQVKREIEDPINDSDIVLGVDFGIKALAVCSDGTVYENPRPLDSAERKLRRLQKELARRKKGGQNWNKTKRKLQRQYARVANTRRHTLHQISHDIIFNKGPAVVVIENLSVKGMMSNRRLAKAISDVGFGELRRQLEYKAEEAGVEVVVVDRWYPSSKHCSQCGCIKDDLTLRDRVFKCEHCGLEIDRDLNAALNLKRVGTDSGHL